MKLWNKRKYAWLTMAVMTALFSGTTAMAATYDQQINEDLESNRTYWDGKKEYAMMEPMRSRRMHSFPSSPRP